MPHREKETKEDRAGKTTRGVSEDNKEHTQLNNINGKIIFLAIFSGMMYASEEYLV